MKKKQNKVALETGASSGIGRVTARALAKAGYRVFGTSRKTVPGTDGVTMLVCDVTDEASVQALVAEILAQAGRIDLVVNNAGIGLLGAAEESSVAQAQRLFTATFQRHVDLVPNFVTTPPRNPSLTEPSGWAYVGRLTVEKGIIGLLDELPPDHALDVFGSGPLEDEVGRRAAVSQGRIEHHGVVDRDDRACRRRRTGSHLDLDGGPAFVGPRRSNAAG